MNQTTPTPIPKADLTITEIATLIGVFLTFLVGIFQSIKLNYFNSSCCKGCWTMEHFFAGKQEEPIQDPHVHVTHNHIEAHHVTIHSNDQDHGNSTAPAALGNREDGSRSGEA